VRALGVFTDRPAADQMNSDPEFAAFNDAVAPLLATPPNRVELELLHLFARARPSRQALLGVSSA
jgi:quinol monooxygenase YgiN